MASIVYFGKKLDLINQNTTVKYRFGQIFKSVFLLYDITDKCGRYADKSQREIKTGLMHCANKVEQCRNINNIYKTFTRV